MPQLALFEERPVEAIVGRAPSWLVRSGISLISFVFLLLMLLTWFIRYPDTIYSPIIITTEQPPTEMVTKVSGQILQLYVNNNETVHQGQNLLLLESSVNYQKLQALELALLQLNQAVQRAALSEFDYKALNINQLGELQPALNQLLVELKQLVLNTSSEQLALRIANTRSLSEQYRQLQQQLMNKQTTWREKLALEAELLQKKNELFAKGVITSAEILPQKNSYLDKQLALDDINIELSLYQVKLSELEQSLSHFKVQRQEKLQQLQDSVINSYLTLNNEIALWKQHHLMTAPTGGQVSFSQYWSANQHVKSGDVVLTVANENRAVIGKIQINQRGIGKIQPGQRVDIELASYPAMEYGQLVGQVGAISLVPGEQGYLIDVTLPTELTTTHGKTLPFSPNLTGNARVITAEKRLFERFLEKILYIFS